MLEEPVELVDEARLEVVFHAVGRVVHVVGSRPELARQVALPEAVTPEDPLDSTRPLGGERDGTVTVIDRLAPLDLTM